MLPYQILLAEEVHSFGIMLEPRYIFGAKTLDQ
jgi:hypothetical protein